MACSMMTDDGSQVEPTRPMTFSDEEILRTRDLHLSRLRTMGMTWRQIGLYFDISDRAAKKRWDRIPASAHAYYSRSGTSA